MAIVYLADDLKHHRQVALKVLRRELVAALGPERFLQEIAITAQLDHPHILPLLDSGNADGALYYVMPLVQGETLRDRLQRETQLPLDDAIRIACEIADALTYAHSRNIIHRDVKPDNILLAAGHARLGDFGIARAATVAGGQTLTAKGIVVGTPSYMSPEQAAGERDLDGRSDVYSLGCVLYEMLAGEPPFTGPSVQAVLAKRLASPAPRVSILRDTVPESTDRALTTALARVPADRFVTAQEFATALRQTLRTPRIERAAARYILRGLATLAGIALVAIAAWKILGTARVQPTSEIADRQSVAVLPLASVGGRADDEYFAEGMTDELTGALGKVPGLRVAARTSAFRFKGRDTDAREVGTMLGVAHLLEGSVRRSGSRVRVALQVVSTADGLTRWTQQFESADGDVFAVQDSITRAVVAALDLTLGGTGRGNSRAGRTANAEAHDLYLRGLYASHLLTEEGLRRALEYARQALVRDPAYADAYSLIALTHVWLADQYMPPREAYAQARTAAEAALALDSLSADAHLALGYSLYALDWDFARAEREFETAVALDPNSAQVRVLFGGAYLCAVGRWREGLTHVNRAIQLDPLGALPSWEREYCFYSGRQYDSVVVQNTRTRHLDPNLFYVDSWVGAAYREKGLIREALAEYEHAQSLAGDRPLYGRAITLHRAGQKDAARSVIHALEVESQRGRANASYVALAYAGLGERDRAFKWLDRSVAAHEIPGAAYFPEFDSVRSDPRFGEWLRRVGMPLQP